MLLAEVTEFGWPAAAVGVAAMITLAVTGWAALRDSGGSTVYFVEHAAAFMAGYLKAAPISIFPMTAPDPHYRRIREKAEGTKPPEDAEILGDSLLSAAFIRGWCVGRTALGPDERPYCETMQRAELKADSGHEGNTAVYHLFRGYDKHPERVDVGRHLKGAPCDYCAAGAKNHLGDPHATPIPWEDSKDFKWSRDS
jgi:hypothetical protein